MPLVLKDRVKETSTTTGTGTLTLGGAATGFQSFAVIGNGNTTYYAIVDSNAGTWEVGIGTYTVSGTTLSRDTVLESSNSGSLVNFDAGAKDVFVTYPAEKAVSLDDAQTITNKTINGANNTISNVSLSTGVTGTLPLANGGTGATTAQGAMNAFAAATTSGQYLRGNGTNVVMSAIQAADVPTLNQNTTGSAATFTSTTQNSRFNSLGVGTAASGTAGEIRATNNITAYYSDDRLKTKLGNIEDALAKVRTLSGFYYEANETAQALGYEAVREVGVSAQQVQAVQPEIVVPAPIDDKYLTVRYERLVPLLIEAIKELDGELQAIKAQIKG
jgi:hypothetical protein